MRLSTSVPAKAFALLAIFLMACMPMLAVTGAVLHDPIIIIL